MTAHEFRRMALSLPEAIEAEHMGHPKTFKPVPGGWGKKGSTHVLLKTAKQAAVREALKLAHGNRSGSST